MLSKLLIYKSANKRNGITDTIILYIETLCENVKFSRPS